MKVMTRLSESWSWNRSNPSKSRSQLFQNRIAFFTSILSPELRLNWVQHGGIVATSTRIESGLERIDYFFGVHGRHDTLINRLLVLNLIVHDYTFVQDSISAQALGDEVEYRYTTLNEAKRSGQGDQSALVNDASANQSIVNLPPRQRYHIHGNIDESDLELADEYDLEGGKSNKNRDSGIFESIAPSRSPSPSLSLPVVIDAVSSGTGVAYTNLSTSNLDKLNDRALPDSLLSFDRLHSDNDAGSQKIVLQHAQKLAFQSVASAPSILHVSKKAKGKMRQVSPELRVVGVLELSSRIDDGKSDVVHLSDELEDFIDLRPFKKARFTAADNQIPLALHSSPLTSHKINVDEFINILPQNLEVALLAAARALQEESETTIDSMEDDGDDTETEKREKTRSEAIQKKWLRIGLREGIVHVRPGVDGFAVKSKTR